MSDKTPFTFLIRSDERLTLKRLAKMTERSEGATLRWLIRNAARDLKAEATTQNSAPNTHAGISDATS
jgi:hypothetical protein